MRRLLFAVLAAAALFGGTLSAPGTTESRALAMSVPPSGSLATVLGRLSAHPSGSRVVAHRSAAREAASPTRFLLVDAAGARVRAWPGGPALGWMPMTTPLGARSWAWAVTTAPHGWARIVLPWRPNGRYGWIRTAGRQTVTTRIWVHADLSRRTVALMRGNGTLRTFSAAVGAPSTPTPTGRFSVTDLVLTGDPSGPFGWYAFGLSGHQPTLPAGWSGGDQLAIHGTNAPSSIGTAASAGCLRVSASALGILRHYLRLGTPVVIDR